MPDLNSRKRGGSQTEVCDRIAHDGGGTFLVCAFLKTDEEVATLREVGE